MRVADREQDAVGADGQGVVDVPCARPRGLAVAHRSMPPRSWSPSFLAVRVIVGSRPPSGRGEAWGRFGVISTRSHGIR